MSVAFAKHPRVDDEIATIADYIGERNSSAGLNFIGAVEQAFERIRDFPQIAAPLEYGDDPRLRTLRLWPIPGFENFVIVYQFARDRIAVLHVLHAAQDLERLLRPDQ